LAQWDIENGDQYQELIVRGELFQKDIVSAMFFIELARDCPKQEIERKFLLG